MRCMGHFSVLTPWDNTDQYLRVIFTESAPLVGATIHVANAVNYNCHPLPLVIDIHLMMAKRTQQARQPTLSLNQRDDCKTRLKGHKELST